MSQAGFDGDLEPRTVPFWREESLRRRQEQLARIPDLSKALREAPPAITRQVFMSFDLQIAYDKAQRRVELTATVSEAGAGAFENAKTLQAEGSSVVVGDIAGGPIRLSLRRADPRPCAAPGLT